MKPADVFPARMDIVVAIMPPSRRPLKVASTIEEIPPREEKRPVTVMRTGRHASTQSRRIRLTAFS